MKMTPKRLCLSIVISLFANCGFTAGAAETASPDVPSFDGARAFAHLEKQVAFGPRIPDSPGLARTRDYILSHLSQHGFTTGTQAFSGRSDLLGRIVQGQNLYGTFPPGKPVKYVFSAHYDTRPVADMAPAGPARSTPVPGANDGASGVAVLLEMARILQASPPPHGIALVFFDLEDHGAPSHPEGFCLGSRYLAGHLPPELRGFTGGVNLDMVGDRELRLLVEGYSRGKAPELAKAFWDVGARLHPTVFVKQIGSPIYDDHVPFLEAGYPYIDVIDFEYTPWHTPQDTPDKCSPDSLRAVGETALEFLKR